ncbi:DUF2306 domain-containing protein [Saccharophagus degradans]|uniref:DUF2306 domain-containing protein n=1 Tax=Saccharophagus degradans (strain 2-40 / ATCC 43961 / DSM 17024) TaxID=203122 RepID=Q21E02_SACD2|nr:DUF2306 domain-containing protein [Saccharophagus degradans]ABD83077.1 hypothetical protein Sde_3822 [Saccharophagus degradans 2-40]
MLIALLSYFGSHQVGLIHTLCAVLALLVGWRVLAKPKGGKSHKLWGFSYVMLMLALNISALFIHNLFVFGPFHIAALFSLITVCIGIVAALPHTPHALRLHFDCMSWSYVGLMAAFFSEGITRLPWLASGAAFTGSVILMSLITCVIGGITIHLRRPKWQKLTTAYKKEFIGTPHKSI